MEATAAAATYLSPDTDGKAAAAVGHEAMAVYVTA